MHSGDHAAWPTPATAPLAILRAMAVSLSAGERQVAVGGSFEGYPLDPPYTVGQPYDECFAPDGTIRPPYDRLIGDLSRLARPISGPGPRRWI